MKRLIWLVVLAFQSVSTFAAEDTNARRPTLFIVGDSTASNSGRKGWGDHVAEYSDATKIRVLNRARSGRSSRTFQTERHWDKVLAEMNAGDFVLIQFGHNDGGPVAAAPVRGSLRGLGEETQEVTLIDGSKEVVRTFGWYLRKYVSDTKSKGAMPILLSLTVRNIWKNGKVERGSGSFGQWTADIARKEGVAFLDLTALIADEYEKFGQEKVKPFFPIDHTHTSVEGAAFNASLVVAGLAETKSVPLANYLSQKRKKILEYPPAKSQ